MSRFRTSTQRQAHHLYGVTGPRHSDSRKKAAAAIRNLRKKGDRRLPLKAAGSPHSTATRKIREGSQRKMQMHRAKYG